MNRHWRFALVVSGIGVLAGCQDDLTTVVDGDLIPLDALTVEVTLPFEVFGQDFQTWGGYGRIYELSREVVAKDFGGALNARVLNSYATYPDSIVIPDTTGAYVPDTTLTYLGATLVARFDPGTSVSNGPVALALRTVPQEWDPLTASWDLAVDSVGEQRPWLEPGAGPSTLLATSVWDPSAGDSAVFLLDSADVNLLSDSVEARKGMRLDAITSGVRLDLSSLSYRLSARPSVNPDTLLDLSVLSRARTFIFDPEPEPPGSEMRIGGAPAWRSVFRLELPDTLFGPPEFCAKVQCPLPLEPQSLVSASLLLTTRAVPAAFQPRDTLFLDVRPVLEPSRLPKSPLGSALVQSPGVAVGPEGFGDEAGSVLEIPLSAYIQSQIAFGDESPTATMALLSSFEPLSLYFAAFEGPESLSPPKLRIVLTLSKDVGIR